jgi:putative membrane protein
MESRGEPSSEPKRPLPDLRIVQANERTVLAWVRTALGLIVLGFGLTRLNALFEPGSPLATPWAFPLGVAFALVGLAVLPIAALRHQRIFRDLCADRPVLPRPGLAVALALALLGLGLVLLGFILAAGA